MSDVMPMSQTEQLKPKTSEFSKDHTPGKWRAWESDDFKPVFCPGAHSASQAHVNTSLKIPVVYPRESK